MNDLYEPEDPFQCCPPTQTLVLQEVSIPLVSPPEPFALLLSPVCAMCLALLILLDFLTQMTVGEDISKIINISSLYNLLLSLFISPSQAEISSSTSCSKRTSVFAPSSV